MPVQHGSMRDDDIKQGFQMDAAGIDRYAEDQHRPNAANNIIKGEDTSYFTDYTVEACRALVTEARINPARIIDFGSGTGHSIPAFNRVFPGAEPVCSDTSQRSLDLASARFPGRHHSLRIIGKQIPAANDSFDLAVSTCVFHHIPTTGHEPWPHKLSRVTRPGGLLQIFEQNPLNPLPRHAVNTCPFNANARLIRAGQLARECRAAGWDRARVLYHTFFSRFLAALRRFERALTWAPFGAQYSVTARKPAMPVVTP